MPREREAGAAAVEFVLISVLLVLLLFGVLQVAAFFYARNIVAASMVLWSAMTAILGLTQNFWQFLAARFFSGLGIGAS